MKFLIITIFALSFFLNSCASREQRLERTKEKVNVINEELKTIKGENLFYSDEKNRSRFTFYLIDEKIKFINEELFSEFGHFVNLYYFENRKLIYLDSKSLGYIPDENGFIKKPATRKIYFYGDEILESDVIIKSERVELSRDELDEIIGHSNTLMRLSSEHLDQHDHS